MIVSDDIRFAFARTNLLGTSIVDLTAKWTNGIGLRHYVEVSSSQGAFFTQRVLTVPTQNTSATQGGRGGFTNGGA